MTSISNSRWQTRKEHPNRFIHNGDIDEKVSLITDKIVKNVYGPESMRKTTTQPTQSKSYANRFYKNRTLFSLLLSSYLVD